MVWKMVKGGLEEGAVMPRRKEKGSSFQRMQEMEIQLI